MASKSLFECLEYFFFGSSEIQKCNELIEDIEREFRETERKCKHEWVYYPDISMYMCKHCTAAKKRWER